MSLAFCRLFLSAGVYSSGTPGQVLKKIKKEVMKLEHAGGNGGGRNGGRKGPRVLMSLFLFDLFST